MDKPVEPAPSTQRVDDAQLQEVSQQERLMQQFGTEQYFKRRQRPSGISDDMGEGDRKPALFRRRTDLNPSRGG